MKIVVQRVCQATVFVREKEIASIKNGLLLLVGIDDGDTEETVQEMVNKVLKFRIFSDENDKMNHSVLQVRGEILLVPNFTLSANTEKGNRPSFVKAASPDIAESLFNTMADLFSKKIATETGEFGADMQINLQNNGPVTFVIES